MSLIALLQTLNLYSSYSLFVLHLSATFKQKLKTYFFHCHFPACNISPYWRTVAAMLLHFVHLKLWLIQRNYTFYITNSILTTHNVFSPFISQTFRHTSLTPKMISHRSLSERLLLSLNSSKTDFLIIRLKPQLSKLSLHFCLVLFAELITWVWSFTGFFSVLVCFSYVQQTKLASSLVLIFGRTRE